MTDDETRITRRQAAVCAGTALASLVSVGTATTSSTASAQNETESEPADEEQSIWELWDNFLAFVVTVVLALAALGLGSRSLAVAVVPAYLLFAYIAIQTEHSMLVDVLYVTVVLVFIGFAFKVWRLEGSGDA